MEQTLIKIKWGKQICGVYILTCHCNVLRRLCDYCIDRRIYLDGYLWQFPLLVQQPPFIIKKKRSQKVYLNILRQVRVEKMVNLPFTQQLFPVQFIHSIICITIVLKLLKKKTKKKKTREKHSRLKILIKLLMTNWIIDFICAPETVYLQQIRSHFWWEYLLYDRTLWKIFPSLSRGRHRVILQHILGIQPFSLLLSAN